MCLLCIFGNKSLQNGFPRNKTVKNGLTVTLQRTYSFSYEELFLKFCLKALDNCWGAQFLFTTCLSCIDFTSVVFPLDAEPITSFRDFVDSFESTYSQKYQRETAFGPIRI